MKKAKALWALEVFIAMVIAASLIWLAFLILKPEDVVVNLVEFQGKIVYNDKLASEVSNDNIPIEEAAKWGEDAVMSYNKHYLEIRKPDNKTPGIFFYSRLSFQDDSFYGYKVLFEDAQINKMFVANARIEKVTLVLSMVLAAFVAYFIMLLLGRNKFKELPCQEINSKV